MEVPHLKYTDAGPMAPMASAAPAMAQARANAKLGEAIASIGDTGMAIVERVRVTREAGIVSAFMSNLDEEAAKFSMNLTKRPDPEAWVGDWQARQDEFKARAAELSLSPVARQRLSQELGEWSSDRGIRFETQAFTRMTMEGKARINNSLNYHAARGDVEGMNREKARMREAGFEESEIEQVERETAHIAAVAALQRDVEADPAGMAKKLADPDFVEDRPGMTQFDREKLQRDAENLAADIRGQEMDKIDAAFKEGTLRPSDIEAATQLTTEDRAAYLRHMERNAAPTRDELATQWDRLDVLRRARNDAGLTPEMYRDLYYETKAGVLGRISPAYQGELAKELSYLSPAGRNKMMESGPDAIVTREDLLGIGRSMISRARSANAFGDIENGTPEVKEKAWRKAEDAELGLKRFLATNPEATTDDIRAHADALISGTRTTAAKQSLRSMVPGSGGSLRGAVFPPVKGKDTPAGQGESSDSLLPPRDDLDSFLEYGN